MSNWRLIEAEIEDALRTQGIGFLEADNGDRLADAADINISTLARTLADRLAPIAKPVQVKAVCKVQP